MPYDPDNPPAKTKNLSDKKSRQFVHVFNDCWKENKDDAKCHAMAWGVAGKRAAAIAERVAQTVIAFDCPKGWEKTDEGCKIKGPGDEWKYYYPDESPGKERQKEEPKPEQSDRSKMRRKQFDDDFGGKEKKETPAPAKPLPEAEAKQKVHETLSKILDSQDDMATANTAGRILGKAHDEVKKLNEKAKTSDLSDDDKANIQRHRQMVDGVMSYLGKRGITKIPGMGKLPAAAPAPARMAAMAERVAKVSLDDKDVLREIEEVVEKSDDIDELYTSLMRDIHAEEDLGDHRKSLEDLLEHLTRLRKEVGEAVERLGQKLHEMN